MITTAQKKEIKASLSSFIENKGSQKAAAGFLNKVSTATISQILNGNWELINDKMWRHLGHQVGWNSKEAWNNAETMNQMALLSVLQTAQENSSSFAVTAPAGTGKSHTIKKFSFENKEAFYVNCREYWSKKDFVKELFLAIGRYPGSHSITEMMKEIELQFNVMEQPILILDEFDKVQDSILYFFISLYNGLDGHAGLVMCCTNYLQKRIKQGVNANKKGYEEIWSRIRRRFIELPTHDLEDTAKVCSVNGVTDHKIIKDIHREANGDMRTVKELVLATRKK